MINKFRGNYYFLNNMYSDVPVLYDNVEYTCGEAAYQAAKCEDDFDKQQFIGITCYEAKKLGKQINVRSDWNDVKLNIMKDICTAKFTQDEVLMMSLICTGDEELINGNDDGDTFWGICDGVGENHLGKILMEIRDSHKDTDKESTKETTVEKDTDTEDFSVKDTTTEVTENVVEDTVAEESEDTEVIKEADDTVEEDKVEETVTAENTEEPKTGYVHISSIKEALANKDTLNAKYDEVWLIVRSLKESVSINMTKACSVVKHVPELSPNSNLFSYYLNKKNAGTWTDTDFQNYYVPKFIKQMHEKEGRNMLNAVYNKVVKDNARILMLCFCTNEAECHRSIIAGLLQGVSIDTGDTADYSKYWDMYNSKVSNRVPTVCFTGHRPDKLHKYNSHDDYRLLVNKLAEVSRDMYIKHGVRKFITGGAQGVDQLAFWAVNNLKKEFTDIQNVVYVPHKDQSSVWKSDNGIFGKKEYSLMLKLADEVKTICHGKFNNGMLHTRNHAMVNDSDYVIAVYNNGNKWLSDTIKGGTKECMMYAYNAGKEIHQINYNARVKYNSIADITVTVHDKKTSKVAQ